jgi:cobalamin synthase
MVLPAEFWTVAALLLAYPLGSFLLARTSEMFMDVHRTNRQHKWEWWWLFLAVATSLMVTVGSILLLAIIAIVSLLNEFGISATGE